MRVVALGGGHGLSATLRAARCYSDDITAIVSVADDGGSSGRLRNDFGIPAPGDLRRCLVALSRGHSPWTAAFEHRFAAGELEGHAFGNLVIAGLADALGDFSAALDQAGLLVGAMGRVVPATREAVILKAEVEGGSVEGQAAVARHAGRIVGVSLVPPDPEPPRAAIEALARADQVVIGPGSLFTSLCAVVAVPALRDAIRGTPGRKVYVANLREQPPETAGYDVADHVSALASHGVEVDMVVAQPGALPVGHLEVACVEAEVADPAGVAHDPGRLASALSRLVP